MKLTLAKCVFGIAGVALLATSQPLVGLQLDEQAFRQLHSDLELNEEAWKSIPWQTDLLEAQRIAAETRKPIFMWTMDGHPLGCT